MNVLVAQDAHVILVESTHERCLVLNFGPQLAFERDDTVTAASAERRHISVAEQQVMRNPDRQ